jgi:REP element-mobilizing transposase RayT
LANSIAEQPLIATSATKSASSFKFSAMPACCFTSAAASGVCRENPNGIKSSSLGLRGTSYLRETENKFINPERVESSAGFGHHQAMPQSLAKILVHTVFSTKDRRPLLRDKPLREELHRYLGGILTNLDCQPIIIGGVEDHVHILSTLSRTCEAADMVKEVKRGSSLWVKTKSPDLHDFAWQNGYGIFSIGFSQVETVRNYIAGQEEHHRKVSFQDEFREFLKRYAVEFDERYVWD